MLTVKQLKQKLEDLPDEMVVVRSGFDHSYDTLGYASVQEAEKEGRDYYCEWYGPENSHNGDNAVVIKVLLLE